jgi:hypothetical protein
MVRQTNETNEIYIMFYEVNTSKLHVFVKENEQLVKIFITSPVTYIEPTQNNPYNFVFDDEMFYYVSGTIHTYRGYNIEQCSMEELYNRIG